MQKVNIGSVEMIALIDMVAAYPAPAVYPKAGDFSAYSAYLTPDGGVELNFASFLVRDGSTVLLVDTGWGPENNGKLLFELAAAGVKKSDVTHVLFTHLHGDHTGWNIDRTSGQPNFPNARHLVPKADWDHYEAEAIEARMTANKPWLGSFDRDVVPLQERGLVDLVSGETTISAALTALPTPGHTPGHTSLAITSGSERGFVLGDVVISRIDAEAPELETSFDWDADIAIRTRKAVLQRLVGDGSLVGSSHLPVPGLGHFVAADGRSRWQGI